jgi:[CysO sulfur-carrier protein]-S-L-cysteine hydrolase
MHSLVLPPAIRHEIAEHAVRALPNEAVGLLGGTQAEFVTTVMPLPNLLGEREFLADPYAQFQAERALRKAGLMILATYHSHPSGGAVPSPADLVFADQWKCAHVIVSLARACRPRVEMRAYLYAGGNVSEIEIYSA